MESSNHWVQYGSAALNSVLIWLRLRREPKALTAPLPPMGGTNIHVTHGGTLIINQASQRHRKQGRRRRRK